MTDKEKYTSLMQRYWEAETTPEEEQDLAQYVAQGNDPDFDEIRGVLGFLSVGREKRARKGRNVRVFAYAAVAASFVTVVAISLSFLTNRPSPAESYYVSYAYGVQNNDSEAIMASVESSLSDFFAGETPAEMKLKELFQR